jgi:BirA family biotin operon repressor/biotin-[acetyl-CoA-carboxylase] ligase
MLFDLITSDRIIASLKTKRFGKKVHAFWQVGSTNRFATRAAARGEPEGTLVIAEMQKRGKGRLKRSWDSRFGKGLWFSIILRPSFPGSRAGLFTYLAGVSVAQAVENVTGLIPDFKWPNDLLYKNKKFCGILSEVEFTDGNIDFIILGIGINVLHRKSDFPGILSQNATSIVIETSKRSDRIELLSEIMARLESNYERCISRGFESIIDYWKSRCPLLGEEIRILQNNQHLSGIFEDLDENGCMMLRKNDGSLTRVIAGDMY